MIKKKLNPSIHDIKLRDVLVQIYSHKNYNTSLNFNNITMYNNIERLSLIYDTNYICEKNKLHKNNTSCIIKNFEEIEKQPTIEYLEISNFSITNKQLEVISKLPNIKHIYLNNLDNKSIDYNILKNAVNIDNLHIVSKYPIDCLDLEPYTNLKYLSTTNIDRLKYVDKLNLTNLIYNDEFVDIEEFKRKEIKNKLKDIIDKT